MDDFENFQIIFQPNESFPSYALTGFTKEEADSCQPICGFNNSILKE